MIINVGESSAKATSYDNSESGLQATNVQEAIDGLKKSVSNGKSTVASAITTKGVTTASDATFDTMATNIKNIPNANSDTYTPTSRAILDMGVANKIRYVNTNSVPNTNSATYTPTWNGTHDLGDTNTYRYVNTNNIYNSGYNNGKSCRIVLSATNGEATGNNIGGFHFELPSSHKWSTLKIVSMGTFANRFVQINGGSKQWFGTGSTYNISGQSVLMECTINASSKWQYQTVTVDLT